MKSPTSVAILLATFNGEKYIKEQIDSIFGQTFTDWTLYISDDGSTDNTLAILKEYQSQWPDKVILLSSGQPSGGAKDNFFFLLRNVEAEYLMFCDQDDVWKADKIAVTMDHMKIKETPNKPSLVYTDLEVVGPYLEPISPSFYKRTGLSAAIPSFERLLVQNVVAGCTAIINHTLRDIAIKVDQTDKIMMHDWWLALIAASMGTIAFLPQATIRYRQHGDNAVGAQKKSDINYVKNRLLGTAVKKETIQTMEQSFIFVQTYGKYLPPHFLEVASVYGNLIEKNKIQRIAVICRYGIWKDTKKRRIMQLIFG